MPRLPEAERLRSERRSRSSSSCSPVWDWPGWTLPRPQVRHPALERRLAISPIGASSARPMRPSARTHRSASC